MLFWEWRRIFRQKIRTLSSKSTLTYQQWSRRRLLLSFVLFFVGWKAFGYTLNDMFLWTVDEETGVGRFLSPKEGKERKMAAEQSLEQRYLPQQPPKRFELDD